MSRTLSHRLLAPFFYTWTQLQRFRNWNAGYQLVTENDTLRAMANEQQEEGSMMQDMRSPNGKDHVRTSMQPDPSSGDYHDAIRDHTENDANDMVRMGKVQELRRNYRPLSALAFTIIIQGTWEVLLTATTQGLVDGGPAGLIWSYVWTFIGFTFIVASLAEMASMAPTAGGQYHWVSEFSPPSVQKPFSFFIGWMSTLSWQAGT